MEKNIFDIPLTAAQLKDVERERYIIDHFENMLEQQKKLLSLLQATKDNTNYSVQALRNEIINYVNNTEKYIITIEYDNFGLTVQLREEKKNWWKWFMVGNNQPKTKKYIYWTEEELKQMNQS